MQLGGVKTRVLLIYPMIQSSRIIEPLWVPLGLSFIASHLRENGHEVAIFDRFAWQARVKNDKAQINKAMLQHIDTFQPDLIGLNTISPLIYESIECINLIRNTYQGILIAGGHHSTALPELTLQKIPSLDYVVAGEGEYAMAGLAGGNDPSGIPGLWWRGTDGTLYGTPPEQIKDLDRLPFPALDLLDMEFYTKPGLGAIRGHYLSTAAMLASRGCAMNCDFCTESLTYGKGVRFHSPGYVTEWANKMIVDYHVEGIYFHDNDFLLNHTWAERICEKFLTEGINKKIKWSIQARADSIEKGLLRTLKQAGCIRVEIGVESYSQQHLDSVDKMTSVEVNERAISMCREAGLDVHASMIIGFEHEGPRDLEQNLNWIKNTRPTTFDWNILEINPGTALYLQKGNDFFAKQDWTEDTIKAFGQQGLSDGIDKEERQHWLRHNYAPYRKWRHRWQVLRVNRPNQIARLLWNKCKRELAQRIP